MITMTQRTRGATKAALVRLDQIDFPDNARPTNAEEVGKLVKSIRLLGLQSAPTVVERNGRYMLVAGRHRVEAMRVIGKDPIPVRIADFDDIEAQLWRISENLHRNELGALERAEQIAEFARLAQEKADAATDGQGAQASGEGISAQVEQKMPRGRPEGGDSFAARDLGITRQEVQRSKVIAALPNEVKARAADLGFDDNQSALLEAAKAPTPEAQVEALERRAERAPDRLAQTSARPLKHLESLAAGELAKWIKQTTPNDRTRVIRMLRECAAILEDELEAAKAA
jgi:ParB family chromosome partitioning protein